MKKQIFLVSMPVFGLNSVQVAVSASASNVPEPFRRHDENSKLTIDYRDLDSALDTVVL